MDVDPLKSNAIEVARFGEAYPAGGDGHIRRAVDIEYCRRYNDVYTPFDEDDFAYCILREEPNVQAVPIAMGCETDFLTDEVPRTITAVGFGRSDEAIPTSGGIKRTASTPYTFTYYDDDDRKFSVEGQSSDWTPGNPTHGDSGSPLFLAMADGTWRVIGIAVSLGGPPPTVGYVKPWKFVEWMLEDPNVDAAAIIPCHTEDGTWSPTPGCWGFPESPDVGSGNWGRPPMACYSENFGGWSETCGYPYTPFDGVPSGGVVQGAAADPSSRPIRVNAGHGGVSRAGCSVGNANAPRGWILALLMLIAFRGRSSTSGNRSPQRTATTRLGLVAVLLVLATGCNGDDDGGSGSGGSTTGPPELPVFDPATFEFRGIQAGIDPDSGVDYESLAVGQVLASADDPRCCGDYVLGSPETSLVRVVFGGDHPGLTFLSDDPDELVDVGGTGVVDVLLADLDDDNRNDLVALRVDHQVTVAMGEEGPPYLGEPDVYSTDASGTRMVVDDFDCDGNLDLAITDPDDDGFVTLAGNGDGTFDSPVEWMSGSASLANQSTAPQDIATGDLDDDGDADVVLATLEGAFTVLLGECEMGFDSPETYPILPEETDDTPEARIVLGRVCPTYPDALAVSIAVFNEVYATCGDGTGTFSDIDVPNGPFGDFPWDYKWSPVSANATQGIADLRMWEPDAALFALHDDAMSASASKVSWLPPNPLNFNSTSLIESIPLESGDYFRELAINASMQVDSEWVRLSFVGSPGLGVLK